MENGQLETEISQGIGTLTFSHPKGNSLPGALLREIANAIAALEEDDSVRVIVLQSAGEKAFCGGASFDEFLAISDLDSSKQFFGGFARVIKAIKHCPKIVIGRIQGKAVGGGVGVACACDYALATKDAAIRLSELALGIGPFIIGPAVERRVGTTAFSHMGIDADWRSAEWALNNGVYASLHDDIAALDAAVKERAEKLAASSPEAMQQLKAVSWEGTDHWDALLDARVEITAKLALNDFAQGIVAKLKNK